MVALYKRSQYKIISVDKTINVKNMTKLVAVLACLLPALAPAQDLQLHYDLRHTLAPAHNAKNYTTLYFQYFKTQDSGKGYIKPGSFLFKMQADLVGDKHNIGSAYMQVAQTLRFWRPKVFLHLSYSGGLGITEPDKQYSYYIVNTFQAGLAYNFQWKGAWLSRVLDYKYVPYKKPTGDFIYTLYWWRGLFNYKVEFSGDFSFWTENRNHGDDYTKNLHGKRFFFFAEPQVWYNISPHFAAGSKTNMYYHVNTTENILQAYPTAAVKYKM